METSSDFKIFSATSLWIINLTWDGYFYCLNASMVLMLNDFMLLWSLFSCIVVSLSYIVKSLSICDKKGESKFPILQVQIEGE